MAQFECNVADLNNSKTENKLLNEPKHVSHEMMTDTPDENTQDENNTDSKQVSVNETIINMLSTDKNIKLVLLVMIVYFVTNTEPFMQFFTGTMPYLTETATSLNTIGKLIIGFLIGFVVIAYQTFF